MKIYKKYWDQIVSGEKKVEYRRDYDYRLEKAEEVFELLPDNKQGKILGTITFSQCLITNPTKVLVSLYGKVDFETYNFLRSYWDIDGKSYTDYDAHIYKIQSFTIAGEDNSDYVSSGNDSE